MFKYVISFSKNGYIKYTSHLDMMRMFKRAFRRSEILLQYSQGFNPHPKMGFAQPLSLGYAADEEYIEFETRQEYDKSVLIDDLSGNMNPRNVGEIENADGTGVYGSPVCGDMMQVQIMVKDDIITDAKFKTFGCGSAIASSSMATTMIIGKSIDEALEISNKSIIDELGGLPAVKVHCSVLADHGTKR